MQLRGNCEGMQFLHAANDPPERGSSPIINSEDTGGYASGIFDNNESEIRINTFCGRYDTF